MRKAMFIAAAAIAAAGLPSAASATVFADVGDNVNLTFGGTTAGTSANLLLTLTGENETSGIYTFSYTLTNTSDTTVNPTGRISSFGFNDNQSSAAAVTVLTGPFDSSDAGDNYPNGIGFLDLCFYDGPAGSCTGNGNGVTSPNSISGSFKLDYPTSLTSLSLDSFAVRYQSLGANGSGSGTGLGTPTPAVPEPATWAMMLMGFGATGFALRRTRRKLPDFAQLA